jgi:hypothetical protein
MTGRELLLARSILVAAGVCAVPWAYLVTLFKGFGSAFGYAWLSAVENYDRAVIAWQSAGYQTWDEYKESFKNE